MVNSSRWSRMGTRMRLTGVIGAVALSGLTGCFGLSRGETVREHYVLGGGEAQRAGSQGDATGLMLGVRRLQLDSYLQTPLIVVRRGAHQVHFSEAHRWGEALEGGISRAVAGQLAEHASIHRVEVAPWSTGMRFDYLVQLHVSRFEGVAPDEPAGSEGAAHLRATWEIIRQQDGTIAARGATEYLAPDWRVGDYAALVTLLDAGLKVLSDDLLAGVRGLSAPVYPLQVIPAGAPFH